jgi:SAM-dependent methyltransferase
MESIRRHHNDEKRSLIQMVTREGHNILDVGSGFGGDLQKWKHVGAYISMCEPNIDSLEEAKTRARNMKIRVNFYHGDIFAAPRRRYDVICYNFSLHYIFESRDFFITSLREIRNRMNVGGYFIGIIPNSDKIIFRTPFRDDLGNFFIMEESSSGNFGEKLSVNLTDTPYYKDGPKPEPIAHRDLLITHVENMGFTLEYWEDLEGNPLSELYSKFIFTYRK